MVTKTTLMLVMLVHKLDNKKTIWEEWIIKMNTNLKRINFQMKNLQLDFMPHLVDKLVFPLVTKKSRSISKELFISMIWMHTSQITIKEEWDRTIFLEEAKTKDFIRMNQNLMSDSISKTIIKMKKPLDKELRVGTIVAQQQKNLQLRYMLHQEVRVVSNSSDVNYIS